MKENNESSGHVAWIHSVKTSTQLHEEAIVVHTTEKIRRKKKYVTDALGKERITSSGPFCLVRRILPIKLE